MLVPASTICLHMHASSVSELDVIFVRAFGVNAELRETMLGP
jgi:hypothetical protein